jgi:hypothetical protein
MAQQKTGRNGYACDLPDTVPFPFKRGAFPNAATLKPVFPECMMLVGCLVIPHCGGLAVYRS